MENNNTKELHTSKEILINKEPTDNFDNSSFYGIVFMVIIVIFAIFIITLRQKKVFVSTTKEQYYKQRENLLDHYIDNKDKTGIKELLNDSSCSKDIHDRAKKVLEELDLK